MNRLLVLCLFGLSASLLVDNVKAALEGEGIIGGIDARLGQFPYQVSLQYQGQTFCSGSIIDDTHVITAAHCLFGDNNIVRSHPFKIIGGSSDLKSTVSTKVTVDVEKLYVPVQYRRLNEFMRPTADIAVVKLNKPLNIESNPNLGTIKLPDPKKSYGGEKAVISGFGYNYLYLIKNPFTGKTEQKGGSYDKMRYAKVYVLTAGECAQHRKGILDSQMCGMIVQRNTNQPEGTCQGDSGGPLVHDVNTLIGVLSTSPLGYREDKDPSIYTRVSSYIDFIMKAVEDVDDPGIRTMTYRIVQ